MSFISPLFLLGLAAAALPVLYHLVRRTTAKRVPFGSLMLLQATPQEVVRRRKLKDVLLMALRCCIFLLLAFVFARPFIPQEAIPFISQRENESVVFLLDTSYSMQLGDTFAQAQAALEERLASVEGRDEVALITFASQPLPLTELTQDVDLVQNLLTNVAPTYEATDFYPALRLAEEWLGDAQHEQRVIVLVSDFQQNGWSGAFENWKLTSGIQLEPIKIDAGQDAASNAYVEAFNLDQRRRGDAVALRYDARVRVSGDLAQETRPVDLVLDAEVADQTISLAQAERTVTFQRIAERPEVVQGAIRLPGDVLPVDDAFYFSYAVQGRPAILVIDEAPRSGRRDAFFLQRAFDLGETARYAYEEGTRAQLTASRLRSADVVVLANLDRLTSGQVGVLRSYVEEGGSVVFSFGPRTDVAAMSAATEALGLGQLTGRTTARSIQAYEAIIGDVDVRHPVFELFAASGMGAILRPTFRQYVDLEPSEEAVVVARFDTDAPMLAENTLGQGRVLAYTSTFSTAWTDFPVDETFVPFIYQLVGHARSRTIEPYQFTVGEMVSLAGRPGEVWEIQAPGDRLFRAEVDEQGVAFFRETAEPGHYLAANGRQQRVFSVNIDPAESLLGTRDATEAYAAIVPPPDDVALTPEQAAAQALANDEWQQKLWRWVLFLILMLFVAETLLAHRPAPTATRRVPVTP